MAYAVIRTDLMSGTKQPADLVSLRFYDASGNKAEVENGVTIVQSLLRPKSCMMSAKRIWTNLSMRLVKLLVAISLVAAMFSL